MNCFIQRNLKKEVKIANVKIGGDNPILIQSMCNTNTSDVHKTVDQILQLEEKGCEIVRVAVPTKEAAIALNQIKQKINIPLVADIHFDYKLAILSILNGADKIRINPGNIGDKAFEVVKSAKENKIPIRIGVNGGSLEKDILLKYKMTPEALVMSALNHVKILEELDFYDTIISIKSSNVPLSIAAHKLLSEKTNYPIHIGITEAGTVFGGSMKSAVGIGSILSLGIGDTIRVSLTDNPVSEIKVAREILKSLGLRKFGVEFISCPTCGRTEIDMIKIASEIEARCESISKNIKVAVMGCPVNGPGEAKEADIGIACGNGFGVIFKKGVVIRKVDEVNLVDEFMSEVLK